LYTISRQKSIHIFIFFQFFVKKNIEKRAANQSPTGFSRVTKTGAIKNDSFTDSMPENVENVNTNGEKV